MISSDERSRCAARLQAHEHVAAVLLGREQPELGTGAARDTPRPPASSSRTSSTFFSWRSVSSSADAGRRQVVDDEAAFVSSRQEARCRRRSRAARRRRPAAAPATSASSGRAEHRLAACRAYTRPAAPPGCCDRAPVALDARQRASNGISVSASTSEASTATDKRERQRAEELPDDAREQAQRREHDHGRQRRADDRRVELAQSRRRPRAADPSCDAAVDVLHHDHRVVDHQADGDRQAAHRHQVDRLAEQPHEEKGGEHGERQGDRGDQRSAASRAGTASRTSTASKPPIRMASRTLAIAVATNSARS